MVMQDMQTNTVAGGSKAPAPGAPAVRARAGGNPDGITRYFAYLKTSDGNELRLGGAKTGVDTIHLIAKTGESLLLQYRVEDDMWTTTVEISGVDYKLVGKVRKAASGTEYLYFWNPDAADYRPNLSVFRAEGRGRK